MYRTIQNISAITNASEAYVIIFTSLFILNASLRQKLPRVATACLMLNMSKIAFEYREDAPLCLIVEQVIRVL